jgi:hypothetical protein
LITADERRILTEMEERGADFYAQLLYLVLSRAPTGSPSAKDALARRITDAYADMTNDRL